MKDVEISVGIQQRTKDFAIRILRMTNELQYSVAALTVARQVARSGTSIGANVEEAQDAYSKKEFAHKMQIALKEARETLCWIDVAQGAEILEKQRCESIRQESEEIVKILRSIVKTSKQE